VHEVRAAVVIIGAGPGGIAAAVTAAEHGCSVIVIDEAPRAGGQIWRHRDRSSLPREARDWLQRLDASGAQLMTSTSAFDANAAQLYVDVNRDDAHVRVHAQRALILATGAREIFLPFPGWTLPGVVGVGAAQALMKAGMAVRGQRMVIAGSGPLLLPVAAMAAHAGAHVVHVAEQADAAAVRRFALGLWRSPARIAAAARYRAAFARTPYRSGEWVVRAHGDERVGEVVITNGARTRTIACDMLCVGYGLTPSTELARLLGAAVEESGVRVDEHQRTSLERVYCVGESAGVAGAPSAVLQGRIAGASAAGGTVAARTARLLQAERAFALRLDRAFALRTELRTLAAPDTLVCRCEDVSFAALAQFASARDAKLQTRAGMGPCQGRVCGTALRQMFGWPYDTVRPPLLPSAVAAIADDRPVNGTNQHED
jgi:NADPH-dependent 2,4-dienoyl-CoA reductase/sulfur reductase-like enzyme